MPIERDHSQDLTGPPWLRESRPQEYNREGYKLHVDAGAEYEVIPSGTPLQCVDGQATPLSANEIQLCNGLLLDSVEQPFFGIAGSEYFVTAMVRGNLAIIMPLLPNLDLLGNSFDKSAWATKLETLGFVPIWL